MSNVKTIISRKIGMRSNARRIMSEYEHCGLEMTVKASGDLNLSNFVGFSEEL